MGSPGNSLWTQAGKMTCQSRKVQAEKEEAPSPSAPTVHTQRTQLFATSQPLDETCIVKPPLCCHPSYVSFLPDSVCIRFKTHCTG